MKFISTTVYTQTGESKASFKVELDPVGPDADPLVVLAAVVTAWVAPAAAEGHPRDALIAEVAVTLERALSGPPTVASAGQQNDFEASLRETMDAHGIDRASGPGRALVRAAVRSAATRAIDQVAAFFASFCPAYLLSPDNGRQSA
jgi:hypothetical protein